MPPNTRVGRTRSRILIPWQRLKQTRNNNNRIREAKMPPVKTCRWMPEFFPQNSTKACPHLPPRSNYISHLINFKCSACTPKLGRIWDARRSYRRSGGRPGPCCGGGFREPSVVPRPLFPFLSGSVCSVRARCRSRPGAAIHWLRHRRRRSLRAPMGVRLPRPLHTVAYIRGARQVPELWDKSLIIGIIK